MILVSSDPSNQTTRMTASMQQAAWGVVSDFPTLLGTGGGSIARDLQEALP